MRTTRFAACIALLVMGVTACQVEKQPAESNEVAEPGQISCTMSATMPEFKAGGDPETKSSLESVVRVKWKKNDELSVINLTTGKQLGGCIKADMDGANSTFSPSGLNGSITAGDKLVFLLDNDPSRRSANEKDFEPFTMDFSSQKGNSNEVPIVVYANYTATANGTINAVNPEFIFLMGYVQLAVSALPASTSVTGMGIENLNTRCHFSIGNNSFVTTPQNGNITLSETFTANSKGTNTRYFSCFTSPAQGTARNAFINANSQNHITAWLKAALSAGYYYQSVATGFTNENISFVDDTFKSYCVSHYDKNGDGEISFAEAAAVTSFEDFTAAEKSALKEVFELPYFFKGERIPNFEGCTALKQILLPGTLQSIQENAFKGCTGLEEITIPSNVLTIGEGAFEGCSSLERFNGTLASADRRYLVKDNHVLTFAPAGLTETTIPDGVTTINAGVFANNTTIKTVNLSAELTTVEPRAFKGCTALPIIRFRTQIASIGDEAFKGCSALRSVYSDAVTPPSVGNDAFANCHASLAAHVTSGNLAAYEASPAWSALNVSSAQPWNEIWYTTSDGNVCNTQMSPVSNTYIDGKGILLFDQDATEIRQHGFSQNPTLTSIQLPDSIISIGASAFSNCPSLSSVTLPNSLTNIGNYAFNSCRALLSISFPASLVTMGGQAFQGCSSLTTVVLPDDLTTIPSYAFQGCTALSSVTLPNNLETIGVDAFEKCTALNAVYATQDILLGTTFSNNYSNPLRYAHNLYTKEDDPQLVTSVIIPDGETSIPAWAFQGCTSITTISIPPSLVSVGEDAFQACGANVVSITDITAWCNIDFATMQSNPLSYSNPGHLLLSGNEITSLVIPNAVTELKPYSFCYSSIETAVIPSNVHSIGDAAFRGSKLTSLVLPNSIQTVPSHMCYECDNLEHVSLSEGLLSIGARAFDGCPELTTITLPSTLTYIGGNAFHSAGKLQTMYVKALTPPEGSLPWLNYQRGITIYVPNSSVEAYETAWSSNPAIHIVGYDFE